MMNATMQRCWSKSVGLSLSRATPVIVVIIQPDNLLVWIPKAAEEVMLRRICRKRIIAPLEMPQWRMPPWRMSTLGVF
jgi:hypothetical protein